MTVAIDDQLVSDMHKAVDSLASKLFKLKEKAPAYPHLGSVSFIFLPDPDKQGRPVVAAKATVRMIVFGSSR